MDGSMHQPKIIKIRTMRRGYCELCEKQCRDENGFKRHCLSKNHKTLANFLAQKEMSKQLKKHKKNINVDPPQPKIIKIRSMRRGYCELCKKQCRDENGFKRHCLSKNHKTLANFLAQKEMNKQLKKHKTTINVDPPQEELENLQLE
ncbi:hypothetical protein AQUCO_04500163v1 [Aquilegia coerulea]|uniref:U1-type domain-containing protein n=1 Tax=Aquilegia coerulea TaxID=218851 RepID=A0A2G5CMF8_AQUCA|nr:hypothetical protein AQUCO_04500163v1 [Aquilegia coerulea]